MGSSGSFPTANCRNAEQLDSWLLEMSVRRRGARAPKRALACAPVCPNLIVHRSNARLAEDLEVVLKHAPEVVITVVGSPSMFFARFRGGALVFADVASIRHAGRAIEEGPAGWCCCRRALGARQAG